MDSQTLQPTTPEPQPENRYPDCLYMELEAIEVQSGQIELPVTIRFNEQWEPLLNGRVKFGLKGGELKLKLENGEILDNSNHLIGSVELVSTVCQVKTNGLQFNPAWVFELKIGASVLKGSLDRRLGIMNVTGKPCCVEAIFEVSLKYLHLTNIEGLYPQNVSLNKQLILEAAIRKHLWESKLKPYLSRVELRYG
ncbi:hypothetical protein JYQ62_05345 [Nostoc sp. UHCC 0702]|nr:hypothetical protein JYQ62_05345 [Nostoc sp. UHCC 0702]